MLEAESSVGFVVCGEKMELKMVEKWRCPILADSVD